MGDVIDTKGYFKATPGITVCLTCRHSFGSLTPGTAPVDALECAHCGDRNSLFISGDAIKLVLDSMGS